MKCILYDDISVQTNDCIGSVVCCILLTSRNLLMLMYMFLTTYDQDGVVTVTRGQCCILLEQLKTFWVY